MVGRNHRAAEGHLVAHHLGSHALAGGDERHLRCNLPSACPLQLCAAVAHHTAPRRQARRKVDHGIGIGVWPRRVIQVQVLTIGQAHPSKGHPGAGNVGDSAIDLGAPRDRAGGDGRVGPNRQIGHDISLRRHFPVRVIRSTAPFAKRTLSLHPSSQRTRCAFRSSQNLQFRGDLGDGGFCVTEEHRGLLVEVQVVVDAGESGAHRALEHDDGPRLVHVEDRHPVDR